MPVNLEDRVIQRTYLEPDPVDSGPYGHIAICEEEPETRTEDDVQDLDKKHSLETCDNVAPQNERKQFTGCP